ncbi:helix-turn-helix domain-containing protein, partial [Hoeflea olei]
MARLAGCGIATVSRVLNRSGSVSPETQRKVISAARELGFEFSDLGPS